MINKKISLKAIGKAFIQKIMSKLLWKKSPRKKMNRPVITNANYVWVDGLKCYKTSDLTKKEAKQLDKYWKDRITADILNNLLEELTEEENDFYERVLREV